MTHWRKFTFFLAADTWSATSLKFLTSDWLLGNSQMWRASILGFWCQVRTLGRLTEELLVALEDLETMTSEATEEPLTQSCTETDWSCSALQELCETVKIHICVCTPNHWRCLYLQRSDVWYRSSIYVSLFLSQVVNRSILEYPFIPSSEIPDWSFSDWKTTRSDWVSTSWKAIHQMLNLPGIYLTNRFIPL